MDDAVHRAVGISPRGTQVKQSCEVDAPRRHVVAHTHLDGHALAGEGHGVERRLSVVDNSVDGHPLSWLHHDDVAQRHVARCHLCLGAVAQHVRHVGPQVHQVRDALAAAPLGIPLKEFANLEKEHHRHRLHHFVLRTRHEADDQRANRGKRHEEVLVEHLAVHDAMGGLAQCAVAHKQVGNEIDEEKPTRGELKMPLDEHGGDEQDHSEPDNEQ